MNDVREITPIEAYLKQNPHLKPTDILIPEQCALCWCEKTQDMVHVCGGGNGGEFKVEPFDY